MTSIILENIFVYPVKSLSGISVNKWNIAQTGLHYDRKWMLIDRNGQFLSQRKIPRMALINTAIIGESLVLSAPGMEHFSLPLTTDKGERIECSVWEHQCLAIKIPGQSDEWFSSFLKQDCHLVYQPENDLRPVDPQFGQPHDQVAFSDGFPFLIISEGSLAALNETMSAPLSMNRFRPNLVISGCNGYEEDYWREIQIGDIGFRLPKPCSRCSVPTIDQATGEQSKEPLATLNRTRKWQNKVYFGQNALHNSCGTLTVGDKVTVKVTGPQQPPLNGNL